MTEKSKKEQVESRLYEITIKAVVVNEKNEVLILKRSKSDISNPSKHDFPGGTLEAGETFESCLQREIEEETNTKVEIGPIVYAFDFDRDYYLDKNKKNTIKLQGKGIRFLAFHKEGEIKLNPREHESYQWVDIQKAADVFENEGFEKDKKIAVQKAREYLEMKQSMEGWKRCLADFENYKKRQAENQKDLIAYSNVNLVLEILPVLDNFHSSTDHIPEDQKKSPWVTGIMHIQKQLEKVMEDNGVSEIIVKKGDKFDPSLHEAVENKEMKNEKCNNMIKQVLVKGYKIDSKVIRAARVIVE
jgi:molecular chaperone GrpE